MGSRWRRRAAVLVVAAGAAFALAACTSGDTQPGPTADVTHTIVESLTRTLTPRVTYTPPPASPAQPLPPGQQPRRGEVERSCPYIKAGLNVEPTSGPNVAEIEGNRIYRRTVLVDRKPVGCRFYFWAPPYKATADILPTTFKSARQAHNAMVRTAEAGKQAQGRPDFVPGVDGILYQTKFFEPDGDNDWAFVFAKGRIMVVVHTEQTNSPLNAELLAEAIVDKF